MTTVIKPVIIDGKYCISDKRLICVHLTYTVPKDLGCSMEDLTSDPSKKRNFEHHIYGGDRDDEDLDETQGFGCVIQRYQKFHPTEERLTAVRPNHQSSFGTDQQTGIFLSLKEMRRLVEMLPFIESGMEKLKIARTNEKMRELMEKVQKGGGFFSKRKPYF
jgi:hypothetical protein